MIPLACAVHCDLAGSPETLAVVGAAGDAPRPRCQDDHRHDACQHDLVSVSFSHHYHHDDILRSLLLVSLVSTD